MQLLRFRKHIPAIVAIGCIMVACSSKNNSETVDNIALLADTIVTTQFDSDTIPNLPVEEEPKDKIIDAKTLVNKYRNTEEALNYMKESGEWEKFSTGILPTMASENLDYCGKLLANPYKRFIVVDKSTMKVILYDKYGNVEKEYGMACAKNFGTKHKKADSRTPEGFFSAGNVYDSREWLFTDDDGVTHPQKGVYGPRFIRVSNPVTTQIGIHGTSSPGSIGKRVSHGCIRLSNESITDLVKYVQTGMPIIVNPGPTDRSVNSKEGCRVAYIHTGVSPFKNAQLSAVKKNIEKTEENNDSLSKIATPAEVEIEKTSEPQPEAEPENPEQPEVSQE